MTEIVYEELRSYIAKYMYEMLRQYKLRNKRNYCYKFFGFCGPTDNEKKIISQIKKIIIALPKVKKQKNTYGSKNISDSDLQRNIGILNATINLMNCDSIKINGQLYGGDNFIKSFSTSYGGVLCKIFGFTTASQIADVFSKKMQDKNFSPKQYKQYYIKLFKDSLEEMQQRQKSYQQQKI
ncbi:MAG: hypothetical protein PVI75_02475 [Gammaproteobacteria bacterium]|jgi:hypothetical protein